MSDAMRTGAYQGSAAKDPPNPHPGQVARMSDAWPPELIEAATAAFCAPGEGTVGEAMVDALDAAVAWRDSNGAPEVVRADWAGVLAVLDAIYPADVFDGSSGDPGPRIVVLMRRVEALTHALRDVQAELHAGVAGRERDALREALRTYGHHAVGCYRVDLTGRHYPEIDCTCGLAALLEGSDG